MLSGFDLSLWLQTPCCGETLWAYNLAHVAFLEAYVGARIRCYTGAPRDFGGNRTLESRLPRWMLAAKHRARVLHGLQVLRGKALER